MALLRRYSASQGLMLESAASLAERGGAHAGCVTKLPKLRLQTIERAGRSATHSYQTERVYVDHVLRW